MNSKRNPTLELKDQTDYSTTDEHIITTGP
jgi:hypothetical protein